MIIYHLASRQFLPAVKTVREFVNAMKSKMGNHILLFHTFIDSTLVVPTDLGLPLVVKVLTFYFCSVH